MNRKIEAGCLALCVCVDVVPVHTVRVKEKMPDDGDRCLRCRIADRYWFVKGEFGTRFACECILTRIDGDPDAVTRDEREEVEA